MKLLYRAIIVDFDRTLLHTDKTISEYTKTIFAKLHEKGIRMFAATARPERAICTYMEQIAFDAVTTLNGARTIVNEQVYENTIGKDSALSILKQLIAIPDMIISIEAVGGLYANTEIPEWNPMVPESLTEICETEGVYKFSNFAA